MREISKCEMVEMIEYLSYLGLVPEDSMCEVLSTDDEDFIWEYLSDKVYSCTDHIYFSYDNCSDKWFVLLDFSPSAYR